jgi:alkanesulfonate monooxygenase SsuD/methylene tetrahydromethanopterin reductase-like flavin-dependent oxidoreductase (luciferase family)
VTEEYVAVMRALWETEGAVSFEGRWVHLDRVHAEPKPAQAPLPLWIGGNHRKAWKRAARLGDGWHPLFPSPAGYAEARAVIEAERATAGRAGSPFTYSYSCPATQILDQPGKPGGLQTYEDFPDLPAEFSYAPPMPTDADGRALFIGDPDQVRADVAAYVAAGVDHFTLRFYTGGSGMGAKGFIDQLEFFAREVMH